MEFPIRWMPEYWASGAQGWGWHISAICLQGSNVPGWAGMHCHTQAGGQIWVQWVGIHMQKCPLHCVCIYILPPRRNMEGWGVGRRTCVLFSLLFRDLQTKLWMGCDSVSRELEQFKCPKLDKNWGNLVSGFTMYIAVVMQVQIWKVPALK